MSSIYNVWAASLTPGVTLNSSKLITIDWGCWQRQQDDVYLHVYCASLSLILCLVTSSVSTHATNYFPFLLCPHISAIFIIHHRFHVLPQCSFYFCIGISMRKGVEGDGEPRTLQSSPWRLPFTRALICINWKGMNLGIWVCRLICTKDNECVLVCAPFSLYLRSPQQEIEVMNAHSLWNNAFR